MAAAEHTHSPTPEEIMEYLDGEGTAASRGAIEAHLAHCAACQVLASEQRRLSADVGAWKVEGVPTSLRAPAPRLSSLLAWRPPARASSRLRWAAAGVAAVLVAAVAITPWFNLRRATRMDMNASITEAETAAVRRSGNEPPQASSVARGDTYGFTGKPRVEGLVGGLPAAPMGTPERIAPDTSARRPAIVRTATLRIVAKDFAGVRPAVEGIVTAAGGFVDHMTATGDAGSVHTLSGTLRIPSDRLGDVLNRVRGLGQVVEDTQGSADVADQLVDLDIRLKTARATERRLTELLANRTGSLSDVLDVERELERVRIEIEQLDAETTNIGRRVSYATVTLEIVEERKAGLGPLSLASRFRIAAADGLESAVESATGTLLFFVRIGPVLALWSIVLGLAWVIARRALASRMRGV